MHIIPQATAALHKLRSAVRDTEPGAQGAEEPIAGATFLGQEPDLAKEARINTRDVSGWAAGGHPSTD